MRVNIYFMQYEVNNTKDETINGLVFKQILTVKELPKDIRVADQLGNLIFSGAIAHVKKAVTTTAEITIDNIYFHVVSIIDAFNATSLIDNTLKLH